MILPTSALAGIILLVLSALCWGCWANTFKAAGKLRYELYWMDFAIGVAICTAIAAFTLGTWKTSELTFQDNFLIASYRRMALAVAGGFLFNLGNTLLLGSLSISGLSSAVPISMGLASVTALLVNISLGVYTMGAMRLGGVALLVLAIACVSAAYAIRQIANAPVSQRDPRSVPPQSRHHRPTRPPHPVRGIVLAVLSGVTIGFVRPVWDTAQVGESGIVAYGMAALVASGIAVSTVLMSPFVITFPVLGLPVTVRDYFRTGLKKHAYGILGGILWAVGAIAYFVVLGSPAGAQLPRVVGVVIGESPAMLAALSGLVIWKEFRGAPERCLLFVWGFLILYTAGVAMISLA